MRFEDVMLALREGAKITNRRWVDKSGMFLQYQKGVLWLHPSSGSSSDCKALGSVAGFQIGAGDLFSEAWEILP